MTAPTPAFDPNQVAELSIGDLSRRTGVTAATLRVWETRYGFPVPERRESGHRRYVEADVDRILEVQRRRETGVRLDAAIEQALNAGPVRDGSPRTMSVFAQLRRTYPALMPHRLRKKTLLALSWAIEDEFVAQAHPAHLFGAFQRAEHYETASARWEELARVSASCYVFADFDSSVAGAPHRIALRPDAAMCREWSVVCDSPELPVALSAWELPGQRQTPDSQRYFEAIWTVDPPAVRVAAQVCATVAESEDSGIGDLVGVLAAGREAPGTDPVAVTSLFNRVIAYVDQPPR